MTAALDACLRVGTAGLLLSLAHERSAEARRGADAALERAAGRFARFAGQ